MKTLLQILVVILCVWGVIHLDVMLYNFLASLIPNGDWKSLIKVAIVVVMVIYTTGLTVALIAVASAISLFIIELIMPSKQQRYPSSKSKFQQKLEEMQKIRKERENL